MFLSPRLSFLMQPIEIGVELVAIDSPDPSAPKFDRRQITGTHERVDLRDAHAQVIRNVLEGQVAGLESRLNRGFGAFWSALRRGHRPKIAPPDDRYLDLFPFAPVWISS